MTNKTIQSTLILEVFATLAAFEAFRMHWISLDLHKHATTDKNKNPIQSSCIHQTSQITLTNQNNSVILQFRWITQIVFWRTIDNVGVNRYQVRLQNTTFVDDKMVRCIENCPENECGQYRNTL